MEKFLTGLFLLIEIVLFSAFSLQTVHHIMIDVTGTDAMFYLSLSIISA